MGVEIVRPDEVLSRSHELLGLVQAGDGAIGNAFLASLLRHAAGFLCPCSAATLRSAVVESLQYLADDDEIVEKVENAIEGLIVGGDLLELAQVTTDDPSFRGTWLFAAPPSYIVRQSGSIFLTGIVADRDTYLPTDLMARIKYDGYTRAIMPATDENLPEALADLGLQPLSQESWLKSPRVQTAAEFRASFGAKLGAQGPSGDIPGLQIIDPSRPVTYYSGRWAKPKRHTGVFVGRRPQEFGSPIWCFVELEEGQPKKLLDLPLPKARWRGCDEAWRLQMAIDFVDGTPQRYRARTDGEYSYLDFYSPVPLWVERRLMILGRHADPDKCLLSYRIPTSELETEEQVLQEMLWLAGVAVEDVGGR